LAAQTQNNIKNIVLAYKPLRVYLIPLPPHRGGFFFGLGVVIVKRKPDLLFPFIFQ
jgi:hypothetical protein